MWRQITWHRNRKLPSWLVITCLSLQSVTPFAYAHDSGSQSPHGVSCQHHHSAVVNTQAVVTTPQLTHSQPLASLETLVIESAHAMDPQQLMDTDPHQDDHQVCERVCAIHPIMVTLLAWSVGKMPFSVRALLKAPDLPSHVSEFVHPPPIA